MNIFLFGNCQTRVLYHSLRSYSREFNLFYVNDVDRIVNEDIDALINYCKKADVFVYQAVRKSNFVVGSDDLIDNIDSKKTLKIQIPSLYFDGYWPNMLDIFMGNQMPEIADGILYKILLEKPGLHPDEYLEEYLSVINQLTNEKVIEHIEDSFSRLSDRELQNNVSISLSHWLRSNYRQNIHFFTCNHPKKSVFDFITNEIVQIIEKQCNISVDRSLFYNEYDMSSINFLYFPPLGRVLNAIGINSVDTLYNYHVRGRFSSEPYSYNDFFSEIKRYSLAISNLNNEAKISNEKLINDNKCLSQIF
jgi:hypothetical protein